MPNNDYANAGDQSRAERILSATINNTEYDEPVQSRLEYLLKQLKDLISTLRQAVVLRGETTTPITDNATTNPIMIDGQSYTAIMNDAVIYQSGEFIFDGTKWHALGDLSNLTAANIGAMTGYSKPNETSAIAIADTLNQAIGKLEKSLDLKQSTLTEPQLAAVNSGIDSDDVAQITTNENNIVLLEQMNGAKNLADFKYLGTTPSSGTGVTVTDNGNGSFTATGTAQTNTYACYFLKQMTLKAGTYYISGLSGGSQESYRLRVGTGVTETLLINLYNDFEAFDLTNDTTVSIQFVVPLGTSVTNLNIKPMIITKAAYDAGFTDYKPYALSNAELTANISSEQAKTTGMTEGGSNYITVNGIRVYVSATQPTGARTGDLWIGG